MSSASASLRMVLGCGSLWSRSMRTIVAGDSPHLSASWICVRARRIRHLLSSSPIKTTTCILAISVTALYSFTDITIARLPLVSDDRQINYLLSIEKYQNYDILRGRKEKGPPGEPPSQHPKGHDHRPS